MAQEVKDPALPELWHSLQVQFRPNPWELPLAIYATKKKKKKKKKIFFYKSKNLGNSCCGLMETNLTSNLEDKGSIPGLA